MIFKGKKTTHHVKGTISQGEIRWTLLSRDSPSRPRSVSTAIISYPCSVLLTACRSEARGHHTTVPVVLLETHLDPNPQLHLLPSRSTGVASLSNSCQQLFPFQCLYASIPSPSPQFTEWSRLSFTGKHWRPFPHDLTKLPSLSVYNACLSSHPFSKEEISLFFSKSSPLFVRESSLGQRSKMIKVPVFIHFPSSTFWLLSSLENYPNFL